jgi:3-methyladenine DNA glycosylase AlkD
MYNKIIKEIKSKENKEKVKILSRFFKTDKGQYGEGDLFLGITVPESRKIAQKYSNKIELNTVSKLIKNKYHEIRLISLLILVDKYKKSKNEKEKIEIVNLYLKNTKYINNWDLVDLSSHYILGDYIFKDKKEIKILRDLSKSKNLWEKRISIISTFAFIYKGESSLTLEIVETLLNDEHDLIQKACGWMLREIGKRVSEKYLYIFLDKHYKTMPRTTLRYSIERLPIDKKQYYMTK